VKLAESYLAAEPLVSASFSARAVAKILDMLLVLAVVCPTGWLMSRLAPPEAQAIVMILAVAVGGSLLFGVYTMVSEHRYGQTIGKHVEGLRVVRESGARIGGGQAVVRQLPMFLQVYWIDVMFALFTEKSQRAFELLSKTRVVRTGK
jgi:uncharacterized RDD family membrane protein YckC